MKIIRIEIEGLLGREGTIEADFHPDLNIITGRNGAGKTTFLKLIWYIMSGNIILALNEVDFRSCRVLTDKYDCTLFKVSSNTCKVRMLYADGVEAFYEDEIDHEGDVIFNAEDQVNDALMEYGNSVFFPTFRRIEGGFTLNARRNRGTGARPSFASSSRSRLDVEEGLSALSKKLTKQSHLFVSSISTVDVENIVLTKYTDLSTTSNELQKVTSDGIIQRIKDFRSDEAELDHQDADEVLDSIRTSIEDMEAARLSIMKPLDAVSQVVQKIFRHNGINFRTRINFGDAANAINSDLLSAGEKQMLSFICYNAFNTDGIIVIDEPELSLHVDWQRVLFPTLISQQTSNQFVVATHSPFIYSKYPDKEIVLDPDRGNQGYDL